MSSETVLDEVVTGERLDRELVEDLILKALDPDDPTLQVVGWPGRRLMADLAPGDLVVRHGVAGSSAVAVVAEPRLMNRREITALGLGGENPAPGRHVKVLGRQGVDSGGLLSRRIAGPEGFVLPETFILRATGEAAETVAPSTRPTIRRGSSGPAVAEAQSRLNTVHARQLAETGRGLDRCPLDVDGKFGPATQGATLSFQRLAFPSKPQEWDGVIGPKTWAQLELFRRELPPAPIPPIPPLPDIPPEPPIIPVSHGPLDPGRWSPILSAVLSSSARLRTGNAVRTLIDGRETFEEMVSDMRLAQGEKDYIYLLGWDITDNFPLIPGDKTSTVRKLFEDASNRGVQIRVMLWAKPPGRNILPVRFVNGLKNGAAIRDDETANNTPVSRERLQRVLAAAGVAPALVPVMLAFLSAEDLTRLTGAHHQKVLIVKRGEVLVAYCGGLDINQNRLDVVDKNAGQPQHDDHCRIVGPSAFDLLQTFIKRWRHHPEGAKIDTGPKGPLRGASEPIPSPIKNPSPIDAPFGGTCSVVIARTFNPVHSAPGVVRERDIRNLVLAGIANARRFIYLEDQYLIDLDTAAALNRAIPRLAHLTILIPGAPISDLPFGAEYRRDFVERLILGLSSKDLAKIGVFQLSSSQSAPTFGRHTYVHAKSWVIDDELAVIGSANCNRRGYQHDSEVNAFIFDDPQLSILASADPSSGPIALRESETPSEAGHFGLTFAQMYRMRLWKEHLGVPAASVVDGVTSAALWRTGGRPASARVLPFNHVLPPSRTQTLRDKAADALRFLIDPVP